jgi:hypothetical protein
VLQEHSVKTLSSRRVVRTNDSDRSCRVASIAKAPRAAKPSLGADHEREIGVVAAAAESCIELE